MGYSEAEKIKLRTIRKELHTVLEKIELKKNELKTEREESRNERTLKAVVVSRKINCKNGRERWKIEKDHK